MSKTRIACVQFAPHLGDVEYNISTMCYWIDKIKQEHQDTDLILFPELATSGYDCTKEEFMAASEILGYGKVSEILGKKAREHRVYLALGYPEYADGELYNSMMLLDRDGGILGNYRKVHPFSSENLWCKKGDNYVVVETDFGKVGLMICYDTSFPEVARTLALRGAELLLVSTNWEKPYIYDWELVTASRAYDNIIPLASANRVGMDRTTSFFGHSKIVNPIGQTLAALNDEVEGYIWQEVNLDENKVYREGYYTVFADRRPETYQIN